MVVIYGQPKSPHDLTYTVDSEDDFIAVRTHLYDLDEAGEQKHHLPDRITLREDRLLAPVVLFAASGNNAGAVARGDV
jgi:hypothetical protein